MQTLLQQISLKDLLTWVLLAASLWYNTQGNQKDKDAEQDKLIAANALALQYIAESNKENTQTLKEVRDELITRREQLKQLSK